MFSSASARDRTGALAVIESGSFEVDRTTRPFVKAIFPPKDVISIITCGGCSCDLYAERHLPFDEDVERAKYQHKGWTRAKIDRAIAAKRPKERQRFADFRDALAQAIREAGGVRLFAHCYSGSVATEPVVALGRIELTLDRFINQHATYALDTLVAVNYSVLK